MNRKKICFCRLICVFVICSVVAFVEWSRHHQHAPVATRGGEPPQITRNASLQDLQAVLQNSLAPRYPYESVRKRTSQSLLTPCGRCEPAV
jgi:hypothetical protein